ncbi:MAG: pyridoxine 5'-phosphate synthase [Candidatus Omnitrophica bacterium]|nr:pyridoxine 5'-phosphate synthase [Candidatus Omnitrophota bacterium]
MPLLGVNIDHVATLRQARREFDPDPVKAAVICLQAGADSIVAHLREDRRHIQDKDVWALRRTVHGRFNLEMSLDAEIVRIASRLKPDQATLVPERRQEITTEGGLDVIHQFDAVRRAVEVLNKKKIAVSLFIPPDKKQILKSRESGAAMIEIHTGAYDRARTDQSRARQLRKIQEATAYGRRLGLIVNAGHGLKYDNTRPIARIPGIAELNIGHAIMARALFVGLGQAVREMKELVAL